MRARVLLQKNTMFSREGENKGGKEMSLAKFWFFEGIVFVILGLFALALPGVMTLSVQLLLGWLLLIGGIASVVLAIQEWGEGNWGGVITALLLILTGGVLIVDPLKGMLAMTALLMIFFLIDGCSKMLFSIKMPQDSPWLMTLINGLVEVMLAVLIWGEWPASGEWVIGVFVGIYMLLWGATRIVLASIFKEPS